MGEPSDALPGEDDDEVSMSAHVTELIALVTENLGAVESAVVGYRQRYLDLEFSDEAAEHMAVEFHGYLLSVLSS